MHIGYCYLYDLRLRLRRIRFTDIHADAVRRVSQAILTTVTVHAATRRQRRRVPMRSEPVLVPATAHSEHAGCC